MSKTKPISFKELTKETWPDFEKLFGAKGACGGCWCMTWRLSSKDFEAGKGERNKKAMKSLVNKGRTVGIIGYQNNEPFGWCSVAPRKDFIRLEKSRVLKPVDDKPVWSISCLFIAKTHRRRGVSVELIKAALKFGKKKGTKIIEGYPSEPYNENIPDVFAWTGIPSSFEKAGFEEAARRSKTRPIMRYYFK